MCNCENEISRWKAASFGKVALSKTYKYFEKSSGLLKVEALRKQLTQKVTSSKSSTSTVLCVAK